MQCLGSCLIRHLVLPGPTLASLRHLALHEMERMGVAALLPVPTAPVLEEHGWPSPQERKHYVELVVVGRTAQLEVELELELCAEPYAAPAERLVLVEQLPAL